MVTVKDVVTECIKIINAPNFVDKSFLSYPEKVFLKDLMRSVNIIYQEIVTDYFPAFRVETVTFVDQKVKYATLSERLIYPVSLVKDLVDVPFRIFSQYIQSDFNGEATFEYNYLPKNLTIDSTIFDERITLPMLTVGALGEFLFSRGLHKLARIFDSKFRDILNAAVLQKHIALE